MVRAPAEAETECARLQREELVNAVCSEDSDFLISGCTPLFRDYRVPKQSSKADEVATSRHVGRH